jgi:hypothetical protein
VCSTLLYGTQVSSEANAGTVPTPPPGTGVPVTVPAPDPLQYPAVSGSVISSSQWNSNFWKNYNDINAIASALNSCTYSDGNGVTSVSATSPIMASISACSPGVGTQLTLSLSGGYAYNGSTFTASNPSSSFIWPGTGPVVGNNYTLGANNGFSANGVSCDAVMMANLTTSSPLLCGDGSGDWGTIGDFYSHNGHFTSAVTGASGVFTGAITANTSYAVPWSGNAGGGSTNAHMVRGAFSYSVASNSCNSTAITYPQAFTVGDVPFVGLTPQNNQSLGMQVVLVNAPTNTGFTAQVCSYSSFATLTGNVYWYAFGE